MPDGSCQLCSDRPEIKAGREVVRVGGGGFRSGWCPLQESNLQLALRRGSLYPFN